MQYACHTCLFDPAYGLTLWVQVYDRWSPEGKIQSKTDRQGGLARARAFETPTQRTEDVNTGIS